MDTGRLALYPRFLVNKLDEADDPNMTLAADCIINSPKQ